MLNAVKGGSIESFWLTKNVEQYLKFAKEVIPSNLMAIRTANFIVASHVSENKLLQNYIDFGCFYGDSTYRLFTSIIESQPYINTNLLNIIGIDCVEDFVGQASEKFKDTTIPFMYVPEDTSIALPWKASAVTMYFVDQVIASNESLISNFKKIYRSMAKGGVLVILRLSEDSFDPRRNFAFYKHNKHIGDINKMKGEGEPFLNELILPVRNEENYRPERDINGELITQSLKFTDRFRKRVRVVEMLRGSGFKKIDHLNLDLTLSGAPGLIFRNAYGLVSRDIPDIDRYDEGRYPLHELLLAYK